MKGCDGASAKSVVGAVQGPGVAQLSKLYSFQQTWSAAVHRDHAQITLLLPR